MLDTLPSQLQPDFNVEDSAFGSKISRSDIAMDHCIHLASRDKDLNVQVYPKHLVCDPAFVKFVTVIPADITCLVDSVVLRTILCLTHNSPLDIFDHGCRIPVIDDDDYASHIHMHTYAAIIPKKSHLLVWGGSVADVAEHYRKLVSIMLDYLTSLREQFVVPSPRVTSSWLLDDASLLSALEVESGSQGMDHCLDLDFHPFSLPPLAEPLELLPLNDISMLFDIEDSRSNEFVNAVLGKCLSPGYDPAHILAQHCFSLFMQDQKLVHADSPRGPLNLTSLSSSPFGYPSRSSLSTSPSTEITIRLSDISDIYTPPIDWDADLSDSTSSSSSPSSEVSEVRSDADSLPNSPSPLSLPVPMDIPEPVSFVRRSSRKTSAPSRTPVKPLTTPAPKSTPPPRASPKKSSPRKIAPLPARARKSSPTTATPDLSNLRLASASPSPRVRTISPAASGSALPDQDATMRDDDDDEEEVYAAIDAAFGDGDDDDYCADEDDDEYRAKPSPKPKGTKDKGKGAAKSNGKGKAERKAERPKADSAPKTGKKRTRSSQYIDTIKRRKTKSPGDMTLEELRELFYMARDPVIDRFPCGYGCSRERHGKPCFDPEDIRSFNRRSDAQRHMLGSSCYSRPAHAPEANWDCLICKALFRRSDALKRHLECLMHQKDLGSELMAKMLHRIKTKVESY